MNLPIWLGEWLSKPLPPDPPEHELGYLRATGEIETSKTGFSVPLGDAGLDVRFLTDCVVEMTVAASDDVRMPSCARAAGFPGTVQPQIQVESGERRVLRSPCLSVALIPEPVGISLRDSKGDVLSGTFARTDRGWRTRWLVDPTDRVYGLGAKTGALERRRRRTVLSARDMVVGEHSDPVYSAIPFVLLQCGGRWLGMLLDSAARSLFDLAASDPSRIVFGPNTGPLRMLVFAGPTLRDVLAQYTSVTGRVPLPPRWSLGHHQSRWSYADDEEVRDIAAEFRRRDIPTDAIHLDIHYMRGFRVFTFHPDCFPDPARLTADLAADGFRLVTIVDPGVKVDRRYEVFEEGKRLGAFASGRGGKLFTMKVWPGDAAFPDFPRAEVREWWGKWLRVYTDAGVAGIWNDMNEPSGWSRAWYMGDSVLPLATAGTREMTHRLDDGRGVPHSLLHNAYGHLQCQATYEGLRANRPDERPFVLTRSAFAGTQRYAAQWTGDVLSSWSALRQSLPMLMGMGLSGMSFGGSDIGGFFGDSTPELYARWIQIGALAPFCRSHTALHTHRQEPWSFGSEVEAIARAALKLRYRLLPYLYTCFWETSVTGMPLWRPLFVEFENGPGVHEVQDQVMIGPALMAAPILDRGATERAVVLPAGEWIDWHTREVITGGRIIEVEAPLQRMPLYLRAGTAVPMQEDVRFTGDRPDAPLVWNVFAPVGVRGELGSLYEDDGVSFAYQNGGFRLTRVRAEPREGGGETLVFGPSSGTYESPRREIQVRLLAPTARVTRIDGEAVSDAAPVRFANDGRRHEVEVEQRREL